MKIDVSTPSQGTGPAAEGAHVVYVTRAQYKLSKSGNPMVEAMFRIIGPEDEDRDKTLRSWYVLTDSQVRHYVALARAIDPSMRLHDPTIQDDLNELIYGKPLVVIVEHEDDEWDGQKVVRDRITRHTELSDPEVELLEKAYGASLVPVTAAAEGDDIPF